MGEAGAAVAHAYPQTAPSAGQFCKDIHVGVTTSAANGRTVRCVFDGRYNRWTYVSGGSRRVVVSGGPVGGPEVEYFSSPSGNIRCRYQDQWGVECYTRNNGVRAVLRSFGNSSVSRGGGFAAGSVVPYGASWTESTFRCVSREAGMECSSSHTGHGFTINRDGAERW